MARAVIRTLALAAVLSAATTARAACVIDVNDEIVNPFEPGCGDVAFTYTEADNSGNAIALGFPPPIPVPSLTPVDGFRTYDSLFARHQSLLAAHDEVRGEVVGATVAGRDIWAYVVGDGDALTADGFPEAAVLVNGGIHAREWQTPEAVTAVLETLAEGKSNAGLEQYLVENLTTVLVPVNNVDGFLETQLYPDRVMADREQPRAGRMRRKNLRNPNTQGALDADLATIADNFWGVDLNRNSAQGYAQANRSSASVTSLVYRSAAPSSEPELLALQQAAALGPAARLRFFSDTHSFSQVHFAPTTGNARRNAITAELSASMRAASERNYRYAPDPQGSLGIGSIADHFAFTYQIPAWTFELEPQNGAQEYGGLATHGHSGFILPDREVARMRTDVVRMYLLGFYRQSGPPAALAAQIRDVQSGEVVFDASWTPLSSEARKLTAPVNRALVPGRRYRLWVAFNKPMRVRDANGAVTPYRGQQAGAELGDVSLHGSLFTAPLEVSDAGVWLDEPGGPPNGYFRYADDAFATDVDLPATLNPSTPTPAILGLKIRDLAGMALDGNPATAADWSDGHWVRYDGERGEGDAGGVDCSFRLFIAAQADAPPPTTTASPCIVAGVDPIPTPTPAARRRTGGGASSVLLLALGALLLGWRLGAGGWR